MVDLREETEEIYGNKVRVRVSGICIQNDQILLIRHSGIGENGILWSPPGGGLIFGETCEQCIIREFLEETGLEVHVKKFLFVNEFIGFPLHAIELFFEVHPVKGKATIGNDPERENQILSELRWLNEKEISEIPIAELHSIFHHFVGLDDLLKKAGLLSFYKK